MNLTDPSALPEKSSEVEWRRERSTVRVLARRALAERYTVRLARDEKDVRAAQALRFIVFNLELNEGLESSFATCRDEDSFDEVCDHLIVEDTGSAEIVGTYRMQSGRRAAEARGYYSAQEFDFAPFESVRPRLVELGRACVHRDHRNLAVLGLLWRGIADYARRNEARYLIGCSSVTSTDPAMGAALYSELCRRHLAEERFLTRPLEAFACPLDRMAEGAPRCPKLLGAYLALKTRICGAPALDRLFKTIDFLTLLDLESLPRAAWLRLTEPADASSREPLSRSERAFIHAQPPSSEDPPAA